MTTRSNHNARGIRQVFLFLHVLLVVHAVSSTHLIKYRLYLYDECIALSHHSWVDGDDGEVESLMR